MTRSSYEDIDNLEELSLFLDNANVCMHCIDANGVILWANQTEVDLLGYELEEFIGRHIADFYAVHEVIAELLQRLSANEDIHHFPVELICKDGSSRHLLINSTIYRCNGEFVHTRFFGQDVTRLRQEEAAHRAAEEQLKALEEKHKQEAIAMAFSAMDDSSRLGYVLQFMKASFACNDYKGLADEIFQTMSKLGLNVTIRIHGSRDLYDFDHSDKGFEDCRDDLHFIDAHKGRSTFYDEHNRTLVSYSNIFVLVHNMPVEDEILYGKTKDTLAFLVEGANASVIRITSGLLTKQSSEAKSLFLANMSHELRTPLNSILGFTQRIISKEKDNIESKSHKALEAVHRNGLHLLELINAILDISKVEAGKMELECSAVVVNRIMKDVHEQMLPLSDNKNIELKLVDVEKEVVAEVDPVKVLQIVTNLVSNAIKFTEQGGVTMELDKLDDEEMGSSVRIQISDSGKGIKEEDQEIIFQKFSMVDTNLTTIGQGTGLGLALVKDFTHMHQGRIEFFSKYGEGSSFSIILPQRQNPVQALSG